MPSPRIRAASAAALALLAFGCDDPGGVGEPDAEPPPVCLDEQALIDQDCFDIVGPPGATTLDRAVAFLDDNTAYDLIAVHVPDGPIRSAEQEAVSLSTRLMVDQVNALGGAAEDRRRLAALLCTDGDGTSGHSAGVRGANHAISCGARALVGAGTSGAALALLDGAAAPTGTPLVAAGGGSSYVDDAVAGSDERDLLWRVVTPTDRAVEAAATLVSAIDAYRWVHVFYIAGDPDDEAAAAALRRLPGAADLVFHGLETPAHELGPAVAEALADQPVDAVVSLVSDPLGQMMLTVGLIEATGRTGIEADLLLVDGWVHPGGPWTLAALVYDYPEAMNAVFCRTMVLVPGGEGPAFDAWALMVALEAPDAFHGREVRQAGTPRLVAARFADAVAVTALALAAADRADGAPSTDGILAALSAMRHTDAPIESVLDWPAVLSAADDLGRVDLVGASGPIDFTAETRMLSSHRVELWRYGALPEDLGYPGWTIDSIGPLLSDADPTGLDWDTLRRLEHDASASPACENARPRLLER